VVEIHSNAVIKDVQTPEIGGRIEVKMYYHAPAKLSSKAAEKRLWKITADEIRPNFDFT
jgi:hypothetical protein